MELLIISRIRHEFKGRQDGCTDQEIAARPKCFDDIAAPFALPSN